MKWSIYYTNRYLEVITAVTLGFTLRFFGLDSKIATLSCKNTFIRELNIM